MGCLLLPEIDGDLLINVLIDLIQEMAEQNEFRGNRGIGLKFVAPMAVFALRCGHRSTHFVNDVVQTRHGTRAMIR